MSDKLKKYVSEHREDFDTKEPGKDVWDQIDARMNANKATRISSKWLSKFKYLGFSASVLVLALYFVISHSNNSSANGLAPKLKTQNPLTAATYPKIVESSLVSHTNEKTEKTNFSKSTSQKLVSSSVEDPKPAARSNDNSQSDSLTGENIVENTVSALQKTEPMVLARHFSKENDLSTMNKKKEIRIPEEPSQLNTYTGTLYDGPSFRSVLRAYKFPGKINLDRAAGSRAGDQAHRTNVRTVSSRLLEKVPNLKAVWVKGRTDKKVTISWKDDFKNIVLVKKDGRELNPEAISHYYPGLGVISEYNGRYFKMIFTDKVELILFFKDAEAGDKIIIDGDIEATVVNTP